MVIVPTKQANSEGSSGLALEAVLWRTEIKGAAFSVAHDISTALSAVRDAFWIRSIPSRFPTTQQPCPC